MGIGNPTRLSPENSHFPTGTPTELREMGKDLSEVFSCAVPHRDGASGVPVVRGCPHAARCAKFFRNEKIGTFGPKSANPGAEGQGPENVPFSIETAEGDYMESYIPCHAFFGGLYGRMVAARDPEANTGERIHILGKAGETKIVTYTTLPEAPGSTTNMRLITTEEVLTVPKHVRPYELDPRWKMKRARMAEEAEQAVEDVLGESVAGALEDGPQAGETVSADALPVRRKKA
jgi:hypothetical protein